MACSLHAGFMAFFWTVTSLLSAHGDLFDDARALQAFVEDLVDTPALHKLNWADTQSVCSWHGVRCSPTPPIRVASLRLPAAGLSGQIRENTLGHLSFLRVLSLHDNRLLGPLPQDLANCTQLRALYLQNNAFVGVIPPLSLLIVRVNLAHNNFSSSIPSTYADLPRLASLFLQNNSLSGSFPSALLGLPKLSQFNASFNQLHGAVPAALQEQFGMSAFLGNSFCGRPLFPDCINTVPPLTNPPPYASPLSDAHVNSSPPKSFSSLLIVAISLGLLLAFVIVACLLIWIVRRRRSRFEVVNLAPPKGGAAIDTKLYSITPNEDPRQQASISPPPSVNNKLVFLEGCTHTFDLDELLRASAEVLGKGSTGTSYKVVLGDGTTFVVKRVKEVSLGQGDFGAHMELLGRLSSNRYLVPLRAYYYSKQEKLLLLDYLPLGSLSALLHGNKGSGRNTLNWITRLKIAIGAAKGLALLHTVPANDDNKLCHGNIKSSNVLISTDYEAAISDYALTPLFAASPASLRIVGYEAPEVADTKRVSQISDTYSFGVLLLELLTGKDPIRAPREDGINLARWVQSLVRDEWAEEVFDAELIDYNNQNIDRGELVHVLRIAIACVAKSPNQRPTMAEVVQMLEGVGRNASS